jgi:hypothetical protein
MRTHAQIPVADPLEGGIVRIYFGTRDEENRTSTGCVEVAAAEPGRVLSVCQQPVLAPGPRGAFDDSGAMPSCVVSVGGRKLLYYIGWNRGVTVPYRTAIGLAVSNDGGKTFQRLFDGPVLDRNHLEPYFVTTPFVRVENGLWRMWYCGCTGWTIVDGRTEPRYRIHYAESSDGIVWRSANTVCIPYASADEANTRPCVVRDRGRYRMWYCFRGTHGYRSAGEQAYRLGYAESPDGVRWQRMDHRAGLPCSPEGWDRDMIAYPFVYQHAGQWWLLYNGNGFGKSGFGYARTDRLPE